MTPEAKRLYAVIGRVRSGFNRLKGLSDRLNRDLDVNASMRAVMESLAGEAGRTVPDIAREKAVSRQHIQVNMDALLARGLVESRDNPSHKRSPLHALTAAGRDLFAEIRRREAAVLERLAAGLGSAELEATERTLTTLIERLNLENEKGREDD